MEKQNTSATSSKLLRAVTNSSESNKLAGVPHPSSNQEDRGTSPGSGSITVKTPTATSDKAMAVHNNLFAAGHRLILIYADSDGSDEDKEEESCEEVEQSIETAEIVLKHPVKKIKAMAVPSHEHGKST